MTEEFYRLADRALQMAEKYEMDEEIQIASEEKERMSQWMGQPVFGKLEYPIQNCNNDRG